MVEKSKLNFPLYTAIYCNTIQEFLNTWALLGYDIQDDRCSSIENFDELPVGQTCINFSYPTMGDRAFYSRLNFKIINYSDFLDMIIKDVEIKKIKIL